MESQKTETWEQKSDQSSFDAFRQKRAELTCKKDADYDQCIDENFAKRERRLWTRATGNITNIMSSICQNLKCKFLENRLDYMLTQH